MRAERNFPGHEGSLLFPFLFGGTFIEGYTQSSEELLRGYFPSFSEGLSLRGRRNRGGSTLTNPISLPFRRDFH